MSQLGVLRHHLRTTSSFPLRSSETLSLIDVSLNAANVFGPQLTIVFQLYGAPAAFAIAGGAAFLQIGVLVALMVPPPIEPQHGGGGGGGGSAGGADVEPIALTKAAFVAEVQAEVIRLLEERHYEVGEERTRARGRKKEREGGIKRRRER